MDPKIVKKTQDTLGKIIKRPPLTEKLLSKPPFRFLHDIMTSVIKTTGFMKGLYTETEMNSDNVKDKDAKIAFLQKAVDMVVAVTGQRLLVKPLKVVAGHEPDNTNEFLQALAAAINAKVNNEDYVKRVLSGGGGSGKGEREEKKDHDHGDVERTRSAGRKRDSQDKQRKEDDDRSQDRAKDKEKSRGDRHRDRDSNEKEREHNRERDQREKSQDREERHRDKDRDHDKDHEKDREKRRKLKAHVEDANTPHREGNESQTRQQGKRTSQSGAHKSTSAPEGSKYPSPTRRVQSVHEPGKQTSPRHSQGLVKSDHSDNTGHKHRSGGLREGHKASRAATRGSTQSKHGSQKTNSSCPASNLDEGADRSEQTAHKMSLSLSSSMVSRGQDAVAMVSTNSGISSATDSATLEDCSGLLDFAKVSESLKNDGDSKKQEQSSEQKILLKYSPRKKPRKSVAEDDKREKPGKEQGSHRRAPQESRSNINLQKEEEGWTGDSCLDAGSGSSSKVKEAEEKENETPETNAEKESSQDTSFRLQRPASAKGSRRRRQGRDNKDEEDEEFQQRGPDDNQESGLGDDDLPPQITAARRMARPSSARPAPPRPKHEGSEVEPAMRLGSGAPTNLITDNDRQSEDEDENFLVEEAAPPPLPVPEQSPGHTEPDDAEHGALVKKMLESKKEAEQQQQPSVTKKTEIERPTLSDVQRRKQREMVSKEIERLQISIQSLTRSANPLGKIMDYVQEDLDSMQKELDRWRGENKEHALALRRERSVTDRAVEPLKAQLADLERAISDQLDLIAATKSNILRNDQRIDKILRSLAKS